MSINQEVWYIQYIWGYYWATNIIMTVGFGDFTPNTYQEAYFVGFLLIILAYDITEI